MTPDDVDPNERVKALQTAREDLERRLHILAEGQRTGFWEYMKAWLEPQLQACSQRLLSEKDVHEMCRLQGKVYILQHMLAWPEYEMKSIREALGSGEER